MGASHSSVELNPQDGPLHEVSIAATEIIRIAGFRGYHTSIIVDDREYFFDSVGILEAAPLWSHMLGEQRPEIKTEITTIGYSHCNGRAMVQVLRPFFEKGSYDVFYKNCNTFSDAALYFLTKSRLMGKYNRIERLVTATNPVSVNLLNRVFKAVMERSSENQCCGDVYVTNPQAADFSVDDLIANMEGDEEESEESEADASESDSEEEITGCALGRSFSGSALPVSHARQLR
mmetsp:Transcript_68931/g.121863  ORF Transcript_68931/g.121863 Transcript_68931/m.121863 type:complete len:233 (-) Transcript_68931:167-865(-)|eukprot:CAMPEP_0197663598 /NCGR_PEP_ID=MMETSP1338-20131121/58068_1 /TAXON_ID=43686 ORGANISM="Pelagodinium beii, Strain RCC1491" /NCGR_SAMPLE_ID=MMETSP1338 /ASSEMBLY_ACC=CAM_ASM_000754 /LENGTH=232 /DNA_ID=CAMNT_0043242055 /DNA_START=71 /DNA_END=769 /DNA_ORIENTATION=-